MSPKDIHQKITSFQNSIRKEIITEIAKLVSERGGCLNIREDSRFGFPSIYNVDASVSIMGLSQLRLNKNGLLTVKAHLVTNPVSMLPVDDLLQLWEVALRDGVD